jgi:hypothetical protein
MQRKISLWRQWADYRDAQAIAIYQNDPALAAHALRDLPLTDEADLADLCQALHQGGTVSKGDWRGLSELWEKAWRLAMVAVNQEEQSNAL